MPEPLRIRRRAALMLAGLGWSGAATAQRDAVEIRYLIVRETVEPSGETATRRFENAVVLAPGEMQEVDIRGEYRLNVELLEQGGQASVRLALWDYERRGDFAGDGSAPLVIGGEAHLTLLVNSNVQYPITLRSRWVRVP